MKLPAKEGEPRSPTGMVPTGYATGVAWPALATIAILAALFAFSIR